MAHFLEEVRALVERRAWEALKKTVEPWPPADIADLLLGLDKAERVLLFRALPRSLSGEVFSYLRRGHNSSSGSEKGF